MVIIKGTSRRKHSNMRAIEIHAKKYPNLLDSLQHLKELRTGILAGVDSDLNNTDNPISSQSSAFKAALESPVALAAATHPPPPPQPQPKQPRTPKDPLKGTQKAGRTDYCTYCLSNFQSISTIRLRTVLSRNAGSLPQHPTPPIWPLLQHYPRRSKSKHTLLPSVSSSAPLLTPETRKLDEKGI
jgi:hypothetical protein